MSAPRVDRVQASYFRKGKCAACGKSTERSRTFVGSSLTDCDAQAKSWCATPITHRRCDDKHHECGHLWSGHVDDGVQMLCPDEDGAA